MSTNKFFVRVLEISTYSVVILTCFLFIGKQFLYANEPVPGAPPSIEVGDQYAALGDLVQQGHEKALVAIVAPDCPFCEKTMPFLQEVVQQRAEQESPLTVLAAIDQSISQEDEAKELKKNAVNPDDLIQLDMGALNISAVPTLLLVNEKGKVEALWKGLPTKEQQLEILEELL